MELTMQYWVSLSLLVFAGLKFSSGTSDTCNCLENRPRDCGDIQSTTDGIYTIYLNAIRPVQVRCEWDANNNAWTVIQRRVSAEEDFRRDWKDYQYGFGDLNANFWLGNDNIHELTTQYSYKLRVDMTKAAGIKTDYAEYQYFSVGSRQQEYKLYLEKQGSHIGSVPDSLSGHAGYKFSTWDNDNDGQGSNCAYSYLGGWWYNHVCHTANLNGRYGDTASAKGINWHSVTGYTSSLIEVSMKITRFPQDPCDTPQPGPDLILGPNL